jgi:AcrR family transcriptional regulator
MAIEQLLLHHTLEELAASGVHGLSVERIADRAQLNKTSIYRRYPTKEALVAAALEGVLFDLSSTVVDTGSLRGDLLALITTVAAFMETPGGAALFRAIIDQSMGPTLVELSSRVLAEGGQEPILAMLSRAFERGEWRTDANPERVMNMLVGALLHRSYLERAPADPTWLAEVVDVILRGCRA